MRYGSFKVETSYHAERPAALGGDASGIRDQTVDERDFSAVQLALTNERDFDVTRHEHVSGDSGRGRVGSQGVRGVAG